MKKLVLLFAFVVLASTASFAQFRAGFMMDYGTPTVGHNEESMSFGLKDFAAGGFGGRLTARYAIHESIDLGAEYGFHAFVGAEANADGSGFGAGLTGISSYQLTGDYYFTSNRFAPYAGLGLGFASVGTAFLDGNNMFGDSKAITGTGFNMTPRAGFKFGAFNFEIAYDMIMGSVSEESVIGALAGELGEDKASFNYSNLRFGIGFIFGSRD